ncbi:carbohydrate sulfotransferase 15-like [Amphiura filiformis]|uniref:carbohydrate sulfotransferase 15-like n=1 Tax=Amphiura filiformis TaxID=82378 RepID=UPI003B2110DE
MEVVTFKKPVKVFILLVLLSLVIYLLYIKYYDRESVERIQGRKPLASHSNILSDPSHEQKLSINEDTCPQRMLIEDIMRDHIPEELYRVAPEVFDNVPSTFEAGLRSPCWRQRSDYKLLCLPSFFLAGVGKCGTTDIWNKIVEHPQIIRVVKEPRWWTRLRYGRPSKGNPHPVAKSFQYYVKLYEDLAQEISDKRASGKRLISGDGSPSVYWDNIPWIRTLTKPCMNATIPPYVIADVIRIILPRTKVITVFRNPTERLYSDYMYENRSLTKEYFHDIAMKSTKTVESCLVESSSRQECIFKVFSQIYENGRKKPLGQNPLIKLFKGCYSMFITDWLRAFPRNQLMFLRLEDWHRDCSTILPNIYRFLKLESVPQNRIDEICAAPQRNPTRTKESSGPMLEETKQLLNKFYKPTRQELADVLKDDRFLWNDSQDKSIQ